MWTCLIHSCHHRWHMEIAMCFGSISSTFSLPEGMLLCLLLWLEHFKHLSGPQTCCDSGLTPQGGIAAMGIPTVKGDQWANLPPSCPPQSHSEGTKTQVQVTFEAGGGCFPCPWVSWESHGGQREPHLDTKWHLKTGSLCGEGWLPVLSKCLS